MPRRRAPRPLPDEALLHRRAFDLAPDALFIVERERGIVAVNQAGMRLPFERAPKVGDSFTALWPASVRPQLDVWIEALHRELPPGRREVTVPRPAGDWVFELSGSGLGEPGLRQIRVRDVTEAVRMAERALHAERLASIGQLSATLAHEIRNTLAGVDGALQVFLSADDLSSARRAIVVEMRGRIARTREVVDDLLSYSRPPRLDRHPWPVGDVLEGMRDSVAGHAEMAGVSVRLEDRCAGDDVVPVDAFNIRQVARNLLLNAGQAMGGRGEVVVSAEARGGQVLFVFGDSGPGIPDEVAARIFEPFFTTRADGTGLGLPIAANIVEAHGGRLYLESARPARFVVALPQYDVSAAPTAGVAEEDEP